MPNEKQKDGPGGNLKRKRDKSSSLEKPTKFTKKSNSTTTQKPNDKIKKPNAGTAGNKKNNSKPPYDKVKNAKVSQGAPLQKPEDWNKFKQEKKELRLKRKAGRSLIDVISKAKVIGEKIRMKKLASAERTKLINELHQLLGNQSNYVQFVLSHDMARIVQYMLKFGSPQVREEISSEIIPSTVKMLQSKYGKFVVKRMLKYGNHDIRSKCIEAFYGHAVKLASHAVSAPVFEYAYSEFASVTDKINLTQEFFGDMYKQSKDANVKHLRDVYKECKDIKTAALNSTKANLQKILNKDLLDSALVQSVIAQFLSECSADDRSELIGQLAPHIVVISNSKDGAKAAMTSLWFGSNKDRKAAMKAMKEHVVEMCKHEHAHSVIICLLDSADDTVLLSKAILGEIVKKSEELIANDWGRRVLSWIAAPADRKQFHPQFIRDIEEGRKESTCKKDADVRQKEIAQFCIKELLAKVVEAPNVWCLDPKALLVTAQVLKNENALEIAGDAFNSLAELVVNQDNQVNGELFIENSGANMSLKKLVQNDVKVQGENTFGKAIVDCLNGDVIAAWIKTNRGCFLLADIYTNNSSAIQERLVEGLKSHAALIKKQTTKGAEILHQKIAKDLD